MSSTLPDTIPSAEAIRTTVQTYVERHTAGDIDGIVGCFRADARVEDPVGTDAYVGEGAVRAFFVATHDMCDRLELELTGPIRVAGHRAAFPMVARSHVGTSVLELDIIDVMVFDEDAKVAEMYAYWNIDDARTREG